ncbi:MAG: Wadjet anti-phage system protein JetA family protein [Casimicrobiaceae bacterium]
MAAGWPLFDRLPERLFGPLASANRHQYWALLCSLHQRRFGPDAPMPPSFGYPVREIVHDIEEELASQDAWHAETGETGKTTNSGDDNGQRNGLGHDEAAPEAIETPLGTRAIGVFNRLRDAGWFRVDRHGVREMVTVRPVVAQFLSRLIDFAQTGPVFVAGKVRSIDANLQLVKSGDGGGDSLGEAADQARLLLEHVRNTGTNVRDLMNALGAEITTAQYVKRFFTDYVQRVFIGDYRELRTRNHPLSRRPQILRTVNEIHASPEHRQRLIAWYQAKRCPGDPERAQRLFEKDIARLLEIQRIDEYLERLDDEIRRANKRALAFLDYRLRSLRPIDHLLTQAIGVVLAAETKHGPDALPHAPLPFAPGDLIGPALLAEPRRPAQRIPTTALRTAVVSIEELAKARIRLRARDARSITPPKLTDFVRRQLGDQLVIASADLELASVTDVMSAQTLMSVALAMSSGSRSLELSAMAMARGFRVRFTDTEEVASPLVSSLPYAIELNRRERK